MKSHKGVIDQFSQHFVKTEKVSKDFGKWFADAQNQRLKADYDTAIEFSSEDANEIVTQAKEFYQ